MTPDRVPSGADPAPPRGTAWWQEFADAAPEFAERVRGRFAANRHHVLGTVRVSGAPRLSGTEVAIEGGHVVLGMMSGSRKLHDVQRDPRAEVHSAPLEEDLASGDAKLAGVLVRAPVGRAEPGQGAFFRLAIGLASLVEVEGDELLVTTWRPRRGVRTVRRR